MEKSKEKKPIFKRWWFILIVAVLVIGALGGVGDKEDTQAAPEVSATQEESANAEEPAEEVKQEEPAQPEQTMSQKNAIRKAESYLDLTGFSKSGLIKQLAFEGFSEEDSAYAVENIQVDWKEQAVKKGKEYLDMSGFSRSGLYDQLTFEGFTDEEATYALDTIGL